MFEGEKTIVFWIGLIILGLASVGLFGILWMIAFWNGYLDRFTMLKSAVPVIVGGVVFMLIGLYMMKSGSEKEVEMQTRTKEETEKETKPENDPDDSTFISRAGALLDFFSDRAVAHASFLVASVFGLLTMSTIIQELGILWVWASVFLFFAFSYIGYFTLVRFGCFADISEKLASGRGLNMKSTLQRVEIEHKGNKTDLWAYLTRRYALQKKILVLKWLGVKGLLIVYWIVIYYLGIIVYSRLWKSSMLEFLIWFVVMTFLLCVFVIVPLFYDYLHSQSEESSSKPHT